VRRLHEHLGVECEVERVAQERDGEQHLAGERPVARVQLGHLRSHHAVLDRREAAVGEPLVQGHAALARGAALRHARAQHHVGLAGHDRPDDVGDDGWRVLAVGVQHHHHVRAALERLEVARLLVAAVADVVGVPDRVDRQAARDVDGLVGRLVVDQDDLVDPVVGDGAEGLLQRARRVAGGHHDNDLGARGLAHGGGRVTTGWPA
jgi:hypothetical protein